MGSLLKPTKKSVINFHVYISGQSSNYCKTVYFSLQFFFFVFPLLISHQRVRFRRHYPDYYLTLQPSDPVSG